MVQFGERWGIWHRMAVSRNLYPGRVQQTILSILRSLAEESRTYGVSQKTDRVLHFFHRFHFGECLSELGETIRRVFE